MTVEEIKKENSNLIACVQGGECCNMNCSECPYDNNVSSYDLMMEVRSDLEKIKALADYLFADDFECESCKIDVWETNHGY